MNIDDVKEEFGTLTIGDVFNEQRRLMKVYGEIEGRHSPINLDTKAGQAVVKDFLWRITEEIGEALDSDLGLSHVKEELADALHFLIELCIFTGVPDICHDRFSKNLDTIYGITVGERELEQLWISLALVGRTCKNKPWKQTEIPIDQQEFLGAILKLIDIYCYYISSYFTSDQEVFQYYMKKAQVNKFRQRSGY